jgi:rod shape-determining protein MreC
VLDPLRSIGAAIGGPMQEWADSAIGSLPVPPGLQPDAEDLRARIDELQTRNDELNARADRLAEQLANGGDAAELDAQTSLESVVSARVVAAGTAFTRSTIAVAAGTDQGVRVDDAVLSGGAVVGRVVAVDGSSSTVRLISDPASSVAVRLRGSRQTALAVGASDPNSVPLDMFDPLAAVDPGQEVVTVGSVGGRPFPPGLPVGTIADASGPVGSLDRRVTVEPLAHLTALDRVQILAASSDGAQQVTR